MSLNFGKKKNYEKKFRQTNTENKKMGRKSRQETKEKMQKENEVGRKIRRKIKEKKI